MLDQAALKEHTTLANNISIGYLQRHYDFLTVFRCINLQMAFF